MPVVAAAAVSFFSATAAVVGSVATAVSAFMGATIATVGGMAITVKGAISAVSTIASIYSMTRKPKLQGGGADAQSNANPLQFKADPDAYLAFVLGVTAVAGNLVYADTRGAKNEALINLGVVSAAGPVKGFRELLLNDEPAVCPPGGGPVGGKYTGKMWMDFSTGPQPAEAINVDRPDTWTAAHKLSGKATFLWTCHADQKVFPNGRPAPKLIIEGIRVYDVRQDSTRGGVGNQRAEDPTTWGWSGWENPYVHASTYLLGYWENGHRVGGVGLPPDAIDWPAFVYGANVADLNGWKLGGVVNSGMDKWSTYAAMLQAGGGLPGARGSKVSCTVSAPKVSVATIRSRHLLDSISIDSGSLKRDRVNTVIPRFRSPAHKYEVVPAQEIYNPTYLAEDGGEELPREVTVDLVQDVLQASQLAAYNMVESRETLVATVTVGPEFGDVRGGDLVTLEVPEANLNGQKMVVTNRRFDPAKFRYTLSLRSETDGKHEWALGQSSVAPPTPSLTRIDPSVVPPPGAQVWTITAPLYEQEDGSVVPVIQVSGQIDDPKAIGIIVNFRQTTRVGGVLQNPNPREWESREFPVSSTLMRIVALPNTEYEVVVRYRYPLGIEDPERATPPVIVVTPALVATNVANIGDRTTQEALDQLDQQGQLQQIIQDRVNKAIADLLKMQEAELSDAIGRIRIQEALDKLTHYSDGKPVQVYVLEEHQARITAEEAFAYNFTLLGARAPTGAGWLLNEETVKLTPELSMAQWRQQLGADFQGITASITQEQTARATADSVFTENFLIMGGRTANGQGWVLNRDKVFITPTESLGMRFTSIENSIGENRGLIVQEQQVRASADQVFVRNFNLLGGTNATGSAWILNESLVILGDGQSMSAYRNGVQSSFNNVNSRVDQEAYTRSTQDSALASSINSVSVTANNANYNASQALSVSTEHGARYGLRLDVNNYVTGFVANNNGIQGGFNFIADYFVVSTPNGLVQPFIIYNGGVYMTDVWVRKLESNVVYTDKIVANNISQTHRWTGSGGPLSSAPVLFHVGVNLDGPNVDVQCFIQIQGSGGNIGHQLHLMIDGASVLSTGTYTFGGHMNSMFIYYSGNNLSGYHEFMVQAGQSSGGGTYNATYALLVVSDRKTEA